MTTHTTTAPRIRTTRRSDAQAGVNLSKRRAWYDGEAPPATPATPSTPDIPPVKREIDDGDEQPIMTTAKLKERLERARRTEREALLKELGIEDPAADRELLASARKRREDEKTEAQKATERADAEKARADKATADFEAYKAEQETKARLTTRDSAIKTALTKENAKADKVLALLQVQHADVVSAVLKDDGTVDDSKVAALVKKAREVYPEDFGRGGVGVPSLRDGHTTDPGKEARSRAARTNDNVIRNG
jgi:hypothetical protein